MREFDKFLRTALGPIAEVIAFAVFAAWLGDRADADERRQKRWRF